MTALNVKLDKAIAAHRAGKVDRAAQIYREILTTAPQQPDALHMLGVIAQQKGNPALALKMMEAALAVNPDMAIGWINRALVLRVMGRREEALKSAQHAIGLDAHLAKAWDLSGVFLREMGKDADACAAHARAIELQPGNADFQNNYAAALLATGDVAAAYKAAMAAQAVDTNYPPVLLGNTLKAAGYPEKAIPHFHAAAEALPAMKEEIALNEAMAWLQIGEFETGWALWRSRPDLIAHHPSIPTWRGEAVDHLRLYEEQGMGDALQFSRYIPLIRDRAKAITLQIAPPLVRILAASFPDIAVVPPEAMPASPPPDAQMRLTDLPVIVKTTLPTIPATIPYLRANEKDRSLWREKLAPLAKPRIGLVWGGNPAHLNNRNRSVPFEQLAPLLATAKGHIVSLQKGNQKEEADLAAANIFDADPWLSDFSVTAGLLKELDLLIAVDTAIVHLAGALGVHVWALLPFDADWRWLIGREDTPWYPSMRLFRAPAPRDWQSVVAQVQAELERFLGGDRSVLLPPRWNGPPLRENPRALRLDF